MDMKTISREDWERELKEKDYAFLAGIIEGEGCLLIVRYSDKTRDKHPGFTTNRPKIMVGNTDARLIKRISEIYKEISVAFNFRYQHNKKRNSNARDSIIIEVAGQKSCKKVLERILPYLIGKKSQAEKLLEFIEYRQERNKMRYEEGLKGSIPAVEPEKEEWYLQEMRRLRQELPEPSETKRKASEILIIPDDDRVRTA